MNQLLFDTPWWLLALLIGAGAVLFWNGNRRQESRVRSAGLALLGVAILLGVLSYFVDTPRERAVKESKQFARAIEARDWPSARKILDPNCTLSVLGSVQLYDSREQIIEAAKKAVERYGVSNMRILS